MDLLNIGEFLLFVKQSNNSKDYYYTLNNKTTYKNLEYYTITKDNTNKRIDIIFDSYIEKNYVKFNVKNTTLPKNVYDIVIDPGHGRYL